MSRPAVREGRGSTEPSISATVTNGLAAPRPGSTDELGLGFGSRQFNRLRILETLVDNSVISRPELIQKTGLSRATVTSLLDELEHAGIVMELDDPTSLRARSTGRPPMLLSVVPEAAFALGLDFGHDHIRVAVCDLSGALVAEEWSRAEVDHDPVASMDLAKSLVCRALTQARVTPDRLLGVGMGLSAPVNTVTGELEEDGILPGWNGIRPAAEMHARLGYPVQLENDANAGALGERVFGVARGVDNVVYLGLSAGIGAGLIIGGQPYRGTSGSAGEIGHVCVNEGGLICRCGNRGCLETVASTIAIAELVSQSVGSPQSVADVLDAVRNNERGACRAVSDAGEVIGKVLATLINAMNPQMIVIGGELAAAGHVLMDPLRQSVNRHCVAGAASAVQIVEGALRDRAEVLGAAALILAGSPLALARRAEQAA